MLMQISLKDLLVGIDMASSKSEANRLIKGNAVQMFKKTEDGHEEIKDLNINTVFVFEDNLNYGVFDRTPNLSSK